MFTVLQPAGIFIVFGIMTVVGDVISPRGDALSKLVVPCVVWGIILAGAAVFISLQRWEGEGFGDEEGGLRYDAKIAICFLLGNICSTVTKTDEGTVWPYVYFFTNAPLT
jgi:uncharacterized membrane protein (DUF4010 family)